MSADLRDLFDQAGRTAPAPTLDPDALLRRARRSRTRRAWLSVVAVGAVAAAVLVVVLAGGGLHQAHPQPPTHPSPSETLYALAAHPLLQYQDLTSWPGADLYSDEGVPHPLRLSPCLTDPLTWGATQVFAATSGPPVSVNEFVLRFADAAAAHRALLDVWAGFNTCQQPASDPIPRPTADVFSPKPILDEYFTDQRGTLSDPEPVREADMYSIHVAREGNVLVVIEILGKEAQQVSHEDVMALAMIRAIPNYLGNHPEALCLVYNVLCPR